LGSTNVNTKEKSSFSAVDVSFIAISIALTAVCSWISIPTTVPFTLQTFAVCLISALLGLRRGVTAVLGYILLGAIGAPVFAGFSGGPGVLMGVTGGYIVGFIFTALIVGGAAELFGRSLKVLIPAMALGIVFCYAFGTFWFIKVYTMGGSAITLATALSWCVLPYIPADASKIVLAALLCRRIYPHIHRF